MGKTWWIIGFLGSCVFGAPPALSTPTPLRPTTITWGAYRQLDQLTNADDQWPFVQKWMDGFVMHGMYWVQRRSGEPIPDAEWTNTVVALGKALRRYGKTAHIETGLHETERDYEPSNPDKRWANVEARKLIDLFKYFESQGVKISKVRPDWFPVSSMASYATRFNTRSARELLLMTTGDETHFGTVPGFDPKLANWREYTRLLSDAFPGMEFGFDQAPCNFYRIPPDPDLRSQVPWKGFGYGYSNGAIVTVNLKTPGLVNGSPVPVSIDFADLLFGTAYASQQAGVHFWGFEGDTPYNYVTGNFARMGSNLMPFLLDIEREQHARGFHNGKIINEGHRTSDSVALTLDLGKVQEIDLCSIDWAGDFARNYRLSGSVDNKNWENLASVTTGSNGRQALKFKKGKVQYLKLDLRRRGTPRGYRLSEWAVFSSADPKLNLALGKAVSANSIRDPKADAGANPWDRKSAGPTLLATDGKNETSWESDWVADDVWDMYFHDRVLDFLETYQAAGGRADQYIAESWKDGPYTLFPETKPGSFTDLAKDLIRRVRGIDLDGNPYPMGFTLVDERTGNTVGKGAPQGKPATTEDLRLKPMWGTSQQFILEIRNMGREIHKGDLRATPLLRVTGDMTRSVGIKLWNALGSNVTSAALAQGWDDGYWVGGLAPSESTNVKMEVTWPQSPLKAGSELKLEVYWNPQDPTLVPRVAIRLRVE